MNTRTFITFCMTALAAFASAIAADPAPTSNPVPLYIHLIGPNLNGDKSSVHLLTVRVRCSEDIEVVVGQPSLASSLTGRIEPRGDKFFVHISGAVGISTGDFDGEVELDKPHSPSPYLISAGGVHPFLFVLSHDSKLSPLLLKQPFFQDGLTLSEDSKSKDPTQSK